MKNVDVLAGKEGEHIAVVHIVDLTEGHKAIFRIIVETGEGYYDEDTDDFGDDTVLIIDKICFEQTERIFQRLNNITFYRGYDGVYEDNRKRIVEVVMDVMKENPYEEPGRGEKL